MAQIVIDPVKGLKKAAEDAGDSTSTEEILDEIVEQVGIPAIKRFTDGDDDQAQYLVRDKPALISAFIVILVFFWPALVTLGSFNQTSGDIGNRGLRYQLLRTERANIFVGRLLGTYLFTLLVLAVLLGTVMLYLVLSTDFYPAGDVILWLLQTFVMMSVYAMPFVAICAWISSAIDSPFGALVLSELIILFPPMLFFFGSGAHEAVAYAKYGIPWGYKWWLLHPDMTKVLGGIAIMVAFTAFFGWLGLRHFQKRDL